MFNSSVFIMSIEHVLSFWFMYSLFLQMIAVTDFMNDKEPKSESNVMQINIDIGF